MANRVLDGSTGLGPKEYGVIVAGALPDEVAEAVFAGLCEPIGLKLRYTGGKRSGASVDVPIRDLTPQEIALVVNRALRDGRIEIGIRPRGAPVRIT